MTGDGSVSCEQDMNRPLIKPQNPRRKKGKEKIDIAQELQQLLKEGELTDGKLQFPDWGITIYPRIFETTEISAGIELNVSSAMWDRDMFERVVGIGGTKKDAIGSAPDAFTLSCWTA